MYCAYDDINMRLVDKFAANANIAKLFCFIGVGVHLNHCVMLNKLNSHLSSLP